MVRYLRLYAHFLRFSFSKAFEFRLDFYFRVVMDCAFYAIHLTFFTLIYGQTETVGGWTLDQAYIFASAYFLVDALHMTILSNNMWMLPILVNKGDLDYYLVRPVSSLFFLSFREFAANSFLNLLIALGIMTWAILRYPGELSAANITTFAALIGCGFFLYGCLHLIFILPAFWLQTNRGLAMVFFSLNRLAERPDRVYTGITRKILLSILPFALIASVPTDTLFVGLTWTRALHMGAAMVGIFGLLLFLWNRALRGYASASS